MTAFDAVVDSARKALAATAPLDPVRVQRMMDLVTALLDRYINSPSMADNAEIRDLSIQMVLATKEGTPQQRQAVRDFKMLVVTRMYRERPIR
jgi:hypothetical protein